MDYGLEGWASTVDIDQVRDVVLPTAFKRSIEERGVSGGKAIKFLWQHDTHKPLGRIESLEIRNSGLYMRAVAETDISWGADAVAVVQATAGGMSFSIGYRIVSADIGEDADGEYLILSEVDLREVSLVTMPCNECAVLTHHGKRDPLTEAVAKAKHLREVVQPAPTMLEQQLRQMRELFQ